MKPAKQPMKFKDLQNAANKRIQDLSRDGVTRAQEKLYEPERQHSPVIVNMEEYEDWTKEAKKYSMDRRLKKEKRDFVGEPIEIEEILKDVTTVDGSIKNCRHVMVIGAAGMGKTTLLRRIAQDGTLGKLKDLKDKLIIMADVRTLSMDEKMLPSQALLGKLLTDWDLEDVEKGYRWMIDNSEKVVFVIDSLDTLPFDLETQRTRIHYHEPATIDTILHNLIAGDLFQQSIIISSSREYKVRNLHPSVRPDRCVLLDGLKEDSVKDLIDGFVGKEKGKEVRQHIDTECPSIWPLLSIPVFLVFSVIGIVKSGFKPKTMSGILVKIFVTLIDSDHARSKNIIVVLGKLMPLSFEGIKKKRVLFSPEHLRKFYLKPEEVTDLGILIPQGHENYLTSKLMQNDRFFLYFNHQTEQECLAALHVLSLNKKEFEKSVEDYLYRPSFSVVRRLMCGILLNAEVLESASKLTDIPEADEKKAFLMKSLGNAIKQQQKEYEKGKLLELLIDLNEAKDGANELIRSSFKMIDLDYIQLSRSDVQAVACVMKRCERLDEVSLSDCNLNEGKMDILHRTILSSNLEVHALYIGVNDLGEKGMFQLAELAKHCKVKVLGPFGCKLDAKRVEAFLKGASDLKLSKLYVSNNASIGIEGMFLLGRLINTCAPMELGLRNCNLKYGHLKKFTQGALDAKLRKLDVSVNKGLGPEGMHILGKIIRNYDVRDVGAAGCNLKYEHVQNLAEGLGSAKVRSLDLNDYSNKPLFCQSLLDLVPHVERELNLRHWQIDEKQQEQLEDKLNQTLLSGLTIILDDKKLKATLMGSTPELLQAAADARKNPSIVPDRFFQKDKRIQSSLGGAMELGGCNIKIARRYLKHDANIKISVEIKTPPDQPKNCVAISPTFCCDLSHARLVPGCDVDVEMQVYCFAQEKVPVVLLEKPSDSDKWVENKELKLSRNRKLKFKISKSFYGFIAFKRGTGMGWVVTFPVVPRLYCNKFGMFKSVLCLDEEKIVRSLDDGHNSVGFASVSGALEPVIAKLGDSIGVELQTAHPSVFTFGDDDNRCNFVTDEVLKQIYVQGDFTLRNIPDGDENQIIKVLFTIEKGRPVPKQKTFSCEFSWPPISEPRATICHPSICEILAQKIKENLTRSASTAKVIVGTKSGFVRLRGCKAQFPESAFDSDTTVFLAMRPQNTDVPEGHKSLSPILKCGTSNVKFRGQATITLPVFYNMDSGNIVILSKKDSQHNWETVKVLTSLKGESVTFKVGHFTRFGIFEKLQSIFGSKDIFLHNSLYFNASHSSLCGLTCIKDEAIEAACINTLKAEGYCCKVIPTPENIRLKQGEQMRYRVDCTDPEQSKFDPDEETICAASTFEHSKSEFHYFTLKPTPKTNVSVKYILTRPGEPVKRSVFTSERNVTQPPKLEDVDATASVSDVQVEGSSENTYAEHMDDDTVYRMERDRCKGRVLIINNDFRRTREGSNVDFNNMKLLWTALGFEIVPEANLNAEEMRHTCKNFASETRNVSVVVVIIMTHGGRGEDEKEFFEGEDQCTVFVDDIIRVFTSSVSPHLQNIPKVFIFQSCRGELQDCIGTRQDNQYQVDARGGGGEKSFLPERVESFLPERVESFPLERAESVLPERADILISFATQAGFTSVRHKFEGSWFINAITNVFKQHAHDTHVLDMFTRVNKAVAQKRSVTGRSWIQISNQDNYLTKNLFLYPGWPQL